MTGPAMDKLGTGNPKVLHKIKQILETAMASCASIHNSSKTRIHAKKAQIFNVQYSMKYFGLACNQLI